MIASKRHYGIFLIYIIDCIPIASKQYYTILLLYFVITGMILRVARSEKVFKALSCLFLSLSFNFHFFFILDCSLTTYLVILWNDFDLAQFICGEPKCLWFMGNFLGN
jgi:hypothetical protein